MKCARKTYVDNIRLFVVLLVLVYHVFYIYNGLGVIGGIPVEKSIGIFDDFLTVVYPWMMILLFVAAGIAARSSLNKRSGREFIGERARKLIVPSTLGLFVIHWVTGYLNIYFGGGLDTIPSFLVYPISILVGQGHLWFAQTLFLFSIILVWLKKPIEKLCKLGEKANFVICLLLVALIWIGAQILNMPVITVYRFGIYFISFIIGYCVLSHEKVIEEIEKARYISLVFTLVSGWIYFVSFRKTDYTAPYILKNIVTNCYAWGAVLSIFGFAKKYFDRENAISRYLSVNSYGYYVLHYPVLMVVAYLLHAYTDINIVSKVVLTLIFEIIFTFTLNEIIKRIPFIRYLVLGIKKRRKNEIQVDN